jgi:hypothetical protein
MTAQAKDVAGADYSHRGCHAQGFRHRRPVSLPSEACSPSSAHANRSRGTAAVEACEPCPGLWHVGPSAANFVSDTKIGLLSAPLALAGPARRAQVFGGLAQDRWSRLQLNDRHPPAGNVVRRPLETVSNAPLALRSDRTSLRLAPGMGGGGSRLPWGSSPFPPQSFRQYCRPAVGLCWLPAGLEALR